MTSVKATARRRVLYFHAGAELYGADKILRTLVEGLHARGWDATVVLPWAGELKPVLESVGAQVVVLNHGVLRRKYFAPCGLIDRLRRILVAGRQMALFVRTNDVALVHTNTSVVLAGALTAMLARRPHVWHIHEITTRPKAVWKLLSWLIPRGARAVICVSGAVLEHLKAGNSLNGRKGCVIHNGIEPMAATREDRPKIRGELGLADDEVLVGMVGRVNAWKGQMAFLDAAMRVIPMDAKVRFLCVGGTFAGEEGLMAALEQRAKEAGFADRVTVWGFREDVASIMAALDVFVLPSTQPDPLPTVVLEAMSLSRPVVGFEHGGICEMVESGSTGLLVPPCDAEALALAILQLSRDEAMRRRFGEAGRARFEQGFSVSAFLDSFGAAYENAIAG